MPKTARALLLTLLFTACGLLWGCGPRQGALDGSLDDGGALTCAPEDLDGTVLVCASASGAADCIAGGAAELRLHFGLGDSREMTLTLPEEDYTGACRAIDEDAALSAGTCCANVSWLCELPSGDRLTIDAGGCGSGMVGAEVFIERASGGFCEAALRDCVLE